MMEVSLTQMRTLFAILGVALFSSFVSGCGSPTAPDDIPPSLGIPFGFTDIRVGTGDPVGLGQQLTVAYTGWLYDTGATENKGDVFDEQTSFRFFLGSSLVIDGWNMGIEGMRVGGLRRIIVPPELGFGEGGSAGGIPPNATLIFEVELLDAKPLVDVPFSVTDLEVGSGPEAVSGQTLVVDYNGWLYDPDFPENKGTLFVQATNFIFILGDEGLPAGWNMGIEGMRPLGTRRIIVPPDLGFGEEGTEAIPPNATLIYEVTLTGVS